MSKAILMSNRALRWMVMWVFVALLSACASSQVSPSNATNDTPATTPVTTPGNTAVSTVPIASQVTSNGSQMGLQVWRDAGYTGKGVTVAVLDTGMPVWGINDRNIRLSANLRYTADFTKDQIVKTDDTSIYNAGHGDDMSQVIGSAVYGAAPSANILNGVIADSQGWANRTSMIKGVEWALNNNANIINLSFGYGALISYTGSLHSNIESTFNSIKNLAVTDQVAIVHSAGNDSKSVSSLLTTASGYEDWIKSNAKNNILIVGATYDNKTLASFSNYAGSDADVQSRFVVAPAQSEVTDGYKKLYTIGTSGAAANVSGALAVMKQRWQSLTGVQLEQIILDTANRSFSGYDPAKFGQGVVDLNAAFSPVGKTSVPVSSVATSSTSSSTTSSNSSAVAKASIPLASAVVTLPTGFKPVAASTAFLDSYGRDFTLTYQTPVQSYHSGLDKTVQAYVASPQNYQQPLAKNWQLGFCLNQGEASNDRKDHGLWFLGMASGYQQHLNRSVLGHFSLMNQVSGLHFGLSATTPNLQYQSLSDNNLAQSEPSVQGVKASLGLNGWRVMPYWMLIDSTSNFTGAQEEALAGIQSEYQHRGWLAGIDFSQQVQPGQALIRNYQIDSQRYYAGYRGSLTSKVRLGLLGFWQRDDASIRYQHPQSVGDGSLRYVTDNLRSQREESGVSASLSVGNFQTSVLSSNFDRQVFIGVKHAFR